MKINIYIKTKDIKILDNKIEIKNLKNIIIPYSKIKNKEK